VLVTRRVQLKRAEAGIAEHQREGDRLTNKKRELQVRPFRCPRRVQLVREEGRDASSQYGREASGGRTSAPIESLFEERLRPGDTRVCGDGAQGFAAAQGVLRARIAADEKATGALERAREAMEQEAAALTAHAADLEAHMETSRCPSLNPKAKCFVFCVPTR